MVATVIGETIADLLPFFFFFFFWVSFLDRLLSMSGFNAGISGFCTFEQTSAQHMRLEYHHIYLSHLR